MVSIMNPRSAWTHLDAENNPAMVDVSGKQVTVRTAVAVAEVVLPPEILPHLREGDLRSPKGPVFQTAILAGTMAAKQTAGLIPLCHPLPLESVHIAIPPPKDGTLHIEATVKTSSKTGVEMEALVAASVAALTVYDMCKSFSPAMEIRRVRLMEKRGGKSDFNAAG